MNKMTQPGKFSVSAILQALAVAGMAVSCTSIADTSLTYPLVDTNQTRCFDTSDTIETCPVSGETGFGQDAQYQGSAPDYTLNGDGTVTDNVTGLMWGQSIDTNGDGEITAADKMTYDQAVSYTASLELGGYSDWRLPDIKTLYSLILFDGEDPSGLSNSGTYSIRPFIDHEFFGFHSGDTTAGERLIDAQYVSSTKYVSTTMHGSETVFGVNFIDGRIKGYGMTGRHGSGKAFYVLAVRGNSDYGLNQLTDNGNGTVTDSATGLVWQQADSGTGMDWSAALSYCEDLSLAGTDRWRLPNAKELQSIVDYTRSPDTTNSAAIDSLFTVTSITNEAGETDFPAYWSSTTHKNLHNAKKAAYVAFGRAMGYMHGDWIDVHGAGAQRSDPKQDNGISYPQGHGPQGDAVRVDNYVRCVSDNATTFIAQPEVVARNQVEYTLTGEETSSAGNAQSHRPGRPQGGQSQHHSHRPHSGGNQDPFTLMDTDGDDQLSATEVRGPLQRDFDRLDSNGDGYLTKDELPQRRF